MNESELLSQVQQGNKPAFEKLVKAYYQLAYRMALGITGNTEVALDISQEAFLRIYRHRQSLDPLRPFSAWLYRIVRNLSYNDLRHRKIQWQVFSDVFKDTDNLNAGTGSDSALEQQEMKIAIWNALATLKPSYREIIVLKDIEGLSYKEIAEMLGLPAGSVMSRLFNARKKLATIIKRNPLRESEA